MNVDEQFLTHTDFKTKYNINTHFLDFSSLINDKGIFTSNMTKITYPAIPFSLNVIIQNTTECKGT